MAYNTIKTEVADGATTEISLASGMAQGSRCGLVIYFSNATQSISAIRDDRGNTYDAAAITQAGGTARIVITSARLTTALQALDKIYVDWTSPVYSYRMVWATELTGVGDQEVSAGNYSDYATSRTAAATTGAGSKMFGIVMIGGTRTYSGSNWTASDPTVYAGGNTYFVDYTAPSAGSQDPGGSSSALDVYLVAWASWAAAAPATPTWTPRVTLIL